LRPCKDDGRADGEQDELAGEQGADESPGLEESDCNASKGNDDVTEDAGTCDTKGCNVGKDLIPGDSRRA